MSRIPMRINTVVSNVPGPPVPLYMCGGRIAGVFPSSIILEGMGLNVTVFSYMDRLDFGIQIDPDLVSDGWLLAEGVPEALIELMDASGLGSPTHVVWPFEDPAGAPTIPKPARRATRAPRAKVVTPNPTA
jgi:hypothetical protein